MFDELNQEPEDMFEQTDRVAPQVAPPTETPVPISSRYSDIAQSTPAVSVQQSDIRKMSQPSYGGGIPWKAVALILGIVVVVGAAIFLSLKILESKTPTTPTPPIRQEEAVKENGVTKKETVIEEDPVVEEEEVEDVLPKVSKTDTDKDGLTDTQEAEYGTSPLVADTDSDGLFDLEEVNTWGTDPINPDTDSDGYLDGKEVEAGYNPNGSGKLLEQPTQIKQ